MQEKLKAIKSKYGKVSLGETTVDMVSEPQFYRDIGLSFFDKQGFNFLSVLLRLVDECIQLQNALTRVTLLSWPCYCVPFVIGWCFTCWCLPGNWRNARNQRHAMGDILTRPWGGKYFTFVDSYVFSPVNMLILYFIFKYHTLDSFGGYVW